MPYFVYYRGAEYRCLLYKKQYETCTTCGRVVHRADVCPQPDSKKCSGCGVLDPTDDHQCDPQCYLCGKGHLTGDKKCKERFKTPYLLKNRMWQKQQRQRDEQQEMNVSTNTSTTQNWKEQHTAENPAEENGNATQDKGGRHRDRSSSFPRLAEGESQNTQHNSDQDPDQGPHLTDPGHGPDPSQAQRRHLRQSPEWVLTVVGATAQR